MSSLEYEIVLLDDTGRVNVDGQNTGIIIDNTLAKIDEVYFEEDNLIVEYKLSNEYDYPEDIDKFKESLTLIIAKLMAELADDLKDENADD